MRFQGIWKGEKLSVAGTVGLWLDIVEKTLGRWAGVMEKLEYQSKKPGYSLSQS